MNVRTPGTILACALLAACGQAADTTNTSASAPANGTAEIEAKIAALPPALQQTTFFRAIRDADYECQTVVNVVPRGKPDGKPIWAVECERGQQYVIELQPGGIFHVSGVPKQIG